MYVFILLGGRLNNTSVERGLVYSSPNMLNAGPMPPNGSHIPHLSGGSYQSNQLPSYLGHPNSPYPYTTTHKMLYQNHSQYSNSPYGQIPSGPIHQHGASQHAQMGRELFNPQMGHDTTNQNLPRESDE